MSKTVREAYEDLEDFWLTSGTICRFVAYASLVVAILYPVVFLITNRWAGWQGFAMSIFSIILFMALEKIALSQAKAAHNYYED